MAGGSEDALDARAAGARDVLRAASSTWARPGSGHVAKLLNNFLNGVSLAATAEVMVAARAAGLDLGAVPRRRQPLERRQLRDPEPLPADRRGRLPRGRPDEQPDGEGRPALPRPARRQLGVTSLAGPSCLGAFHLAAALGYGDQISNRVVDAIGDISGGVRLQRRRGGPHENRTRPRRAAPSEERGPTFTGRVWADPVLAGRGRVGVNAVFFEPGARTYWHTHEIGQVLYVTHGEGRVRTRDGAGAPIARRRRRPHRRPARSTGTAPRPDGYLLHVAVSLGDATWLTAVTDEEYARRTGAGGAVVLQVAPQRPRERRDLRPRRHGVRDRLLRHPGDQLRRGPAADGRE